jgi:DNA-binding MarR family transcriptional regulator
MVCSFRREFVIFLSISPDFTFMDGTQMSTETRFGSPAVETVVMLTQANALLARALGRALAPWGVSWPQALSLFVLAEQEGPISATRLVEHLGLGRTAMTSVVDRLERQGWVQRRPSTIDRRVADLILTDSGRKIVEDVRPVLKSTIESYLGTFSAKDLSTWRTGIDRLIEAVRSATPAGAP